VSPARYLLSQRLLEYRALRRKELEALANAINGKVRVESTTTGLAKYVIQCCPLYAVSLHLPGDNTVLRWIEVLTAQVVTLALLHRIRIGR
jgi:hypothetical protein